MNYELYLNNSSNIESDIKTKLKYSILIHINTSTLLNQLNPDFIVFNRIPR